MILHTIPRISCFVLSDEAPSQSLIDGFWHQNYPDKELVVLSSEPIELDIDNYNVLLIECPQNLTEDEKKDLLIELTTGEVICWWEPQEDSFWLTHRFKQWNNDQQDDDELFFSKTKFHKAANMLYSGMETEVEYDYFSKGQGS